MHPSVSVIVANKGRAWSLALTLDALKRQRAITAEIIVISDAPSPRDLSVRWLKQGDANISAARNTGLIASRGEIIAFCDDDAVPEPDWLLRIVQGFDTDNLGAVGGPVLGADGVRQQWGEMRFDRAGRDRADGPYIKLNGTNMAVRRSAIAAIGGFDTRFAYYLDETDMVLRLIQAGWHIGWQPDAVVHHASHSNAVRGSATTVEGFRQLGRSVATFASNHTPENESHLAAQHLRHEQRRRLHRMYNIAGLSAAGVQQRLAAIEQGLSSAVPPRKFVKIPLETAPPQPEKPDAQRIALAPRILGRAAARRAARRLSECGVEVTLVLQTWLNTQIRVKWCADGYFEHIGGVFRDGNHAPKWREMLSRELRRIAARRTFTCLALGNRRGGARYIDVSGQQLSLKTEIGKNMWRTIRTFDAISCDMHRNINNAERTKLETKWNAR